MSCLLSFRRKSKLKSHKKVYENKDFCKEWKPSEDNNIWEFNQSHKAPFIFYADREYLKDKTCGFK